MTMLEKAGRRLSALLCALLTLPLVAQSVVAQTRLVTPNASIVGLPGPFPFTGREWMNFRQDREAVTAPVATVIGQAISANPSLSSQISALGGGGGSVDPATLPASSTLTGTEASACKQGSTLSKCTPAQQSAYTLGTAVPALPAASVLSGIETSNAVQNGAAVKVTSFQLSQGSRVLGDGIAAPVGAPTPALGGSGNLTGTVGYAVTFVTALGETAPWTGTPTTVSPVAQSVTLSAIPTGPAGVLKRRIYRTKTSAVDIKDFYFLAEIADNTTTTFTDNVADGSLGAPVSFIPTNRGYITDGAQRVAAIDDQSVAIGPTANAGYASVAVGYGAMTAITSGRRNVGMGVYALTSTTTGYQNVGIGTHAGQNNTTGAFNTFLGTYAGFNAGLGTGTAQKNVIVGNEAGFGDATNGIGDNNVLVGYRAGYQMAGAIGSVIAIGAQAGQFANNNRQIFVDNVVRANLAAAQDQGLIYGQGQSTPQTQELRFNARVRLGWDPTLALVANLPVASTALRGFRAYVVDASVAYASANVGSTVAGGGSNTVPVFCNGTAWVIG